MTFRFVDIFFITLLLRLTINILLPFFTKVLFIFMTYNTPLHSLISYFNYSLLMTSSRFNIIKSNKTLFTFYFSWTPFRHVYIPSLFLFLSPLHVPYLVTSLLTQFFTVYASLVIRDQLNERVSLTLSKMTLIANLGL